MKIIVDAMGGDFAPANVVSGVVEAVKEFDIDIALIGIKEQVEAELKKHKFPQERIQLIHSPEVIGMHDAATSSIRSKKNSSISMGVTLLKDTSYDAFVSAGNTGAVVCASTVFLGLLPGVERPGIGLVIPTLNKFAFLIDIGANSDPKPSHLLQYAHMGKIYTERALKIENPRIGLLNIGEEEGKGSEFEKEAYKLLSEKVKNFIGNVEPNEIFSGKCDCVVCDGFVGNVMIKTSEGLVESAGTLIKREIKKSPIALFAAFLLKSELSHIKKKVDYSEYGGAPLMGVNGIVMICHGRSSPKAIKNAIRAAKREVEQKILSGIIEEIK